MANLRVGIVGATGRMGTEIAAGLNSDPEFTVAFGISRQSGRVHPTVHELPMFTDLGEAIQAHPIDVLLDLSHRQVAVQNTHVAAEQNVPSVIGATGLAQADLEHLSDIAVSKELAVLYIPNFAIGAVLMMKFSELSAQWLPDAEIIEMHHERKEDAPSGTAMLTAELIQRGRSRPPMPLPTPFLKAEGARGATVADVPVHSVRLPGMLAHQQVMFGGLGETLTLRHDSLSRSSFLAGVKLSCQAARTSKGLTVGLDQILFPSSR